MGDTRVFTKRWSDFMDHYGVKPSRNNPGVSHENGSVEKSHNLFVNDLEQQLLLRGNRDFTTCQPTEPSSKPSGTDEMPDGRIASQRNSSDSNPCPQDDGSTRSNCRWA